MKTSHWTIMAIATACLLLSGGCNKQAQPSEWKTLGSRISITEFREAFGNASGNEIPVLVNDAAIGVRYGNYTNALAALDKLAKQPSLTPEQKKVTSKVISQVEQLAANSRAK